jgi:photosystem II stability/assembly factor-like uncharacterized protein
VTYHSRHVILALPLVLALVSPVGAQDGRGALQGLFDDLTWRQIGPAAFGGRVDDIEAVAGQPQVIFVGAASGGVFKSVNNGVTWQSVFDRSGGMLSIGDLAIAPSDPNIVWVGTGEPNNRQSSSWGDGVYRSLDGGETWTHMGLRDTHHVGRVVIHPRDPNVVFVAALGHLWGANDERGLFRTRDGGRTWEKIFFIDRDTGVVDVAMDADGRTLFAAAYQRRRRAWGFVGGGAGSGLYKSLDGGSTWEKLKGGLPDGSIGRIGLAIAPSDSRIVYAIVEHKTAGGVYRSDDRGTTWRRQSNVNPRPMYYSQIRVDPRTPDKVWALGSLLHLSLDGGKTFTTEGTGDRIHVDHHALWINPANPDHLLLGNDGGVYFSYDGSRTWDFIDNLPIGQYYDIGVDARDPYWIYGGTQDNGTWALPSRTDSQLGITNAHVINVAYGDGFYTQPDPTDARRVYANSQDGRAYSVHLDTMEERGIRPVPSDAKETYRFNWSTPLLISKVEPGVAYYGGNKLFRTEDRGQTWREISPDLTKNQDWKKLPVMGERNDDTLSRDDGVAHFGTITSIAESPLGRGVLYVGTDDGNVQVTRDGGATWQNVTSRIKLPGPRWVSRVLASRHAAGTAYASFDGHYDDDFAPYLFRTTDFGASWSSIAGNLAAGVVINAVEEHPASANVLLAGTESGLWITIDGGRTWSRAGGTLPPVPVDDVVYHEKSGDVVLGTHGRSIIVLDDASVLAQVTSDVLTQPAHLFSVRPSAQIYQARLLPFPGASEFAGPNPPFGALITYYLRDDVPRERKAAETTTADAKNADQKNVAPKTEDSEAATVSIAVLDRSGKVVRELEGPGKKGLNRVTWDLRWPLPFTPGSNDEGWFGPPAGPFVLPGEHTIRLTVAGRELAQKVQVLADPRMQASEAALTERLELSQSLAEWLKAFGEASTAIDGLNRELQRVRESVKPLNPAPEPLQKSIDGYAKKLEDTGKLFAAGFGSPRFSLLDLLGQLQASTSPPTDAQRRSRDQLAARTRENIESLNAIIATDWPSLQRELTAAGVTSVVAKPIAVPK